MGKPSKKLIFFGQADVLRVGSTRDEYLSIFCLKISIGIVKVLLIMIMDHDSEDDDGDDDDRRRKRVF